MSAHVPSRPKLGEFLSTAICGNDILSSTLYVSGVAVLFAGVFAPLVLLAVAGVLFFYRSVYREVVDALPVNGGSYNALLNATFKTFAALAGVMTILSYIATAVISSTAAVGYLFRFLDGIAQLNKPIGGFEAWTVPAVALILLGFAVLVILGVRDSAKVAAGIFVFHVFTLISFIGAGLWFFLTHGNLVLAGNIAATTSLIVKQGGVSRMLFLGFAASLLGVSGFESSANFVEEQKHGVFAKTLRNMTIGVAIFNPLVAFIVVALVPIASVAGAKDFLLAQTAFGVGGFYFMALIAIDAFLVLSGAVLTSFVGVTGIMKRMTLDRALPAFLENAKKDSTARPVLVFLLLCISILYLTHGDLLALAGVYTVSFLSVMTLFAVGNLILRKTRGELQRPYRAPFSFVLIALCSTIVGLIGNIALNPRNALFFLTYFIPATVIVLSILYKKDVLSAIEPMVRRFKPLHRVVMKKLHAAENARLYVFIHHLERLSLILNYIQKNENSTNVTLVHCKHHREHLRERVESTLDVMRQAGFFTEFRFRVEYVDEHFSPELLDRYARRRKISKGDIFMGSIHHYHTFTYEELGGVRIIF